MSDTPRTDLEEATQTQRFGVYMVKANFARTLERESTAMREQIEHLGKANSMLHLDLVDAHAETAKETRLADKAEVENAALREAIKEAYKIIDVLYMDALDNHKESWPRAREWMELWKEVAK